MNFFENLEVCSVSYEATRDVPLLHHYSSQPGQLFYPSTNEFESDFASYCFFRELKDLNNGINKSGKKI